MKHNTTLQTLPCGITAVHHHCPGSQVAYCGIAVKAGSRNEQPDQFGLAHFVEHTIFKGTTHRRASHIIKRMEAVGGELNAYTTKEETVIYSVFPTGNLARAAQLIADLAVDSQFPAAELEKERSVVADEIDSYLDSPSEAIFDDFEDLIFKDSQLGHNILGSRKTLDTFTSQTCRNFLSKYYCADNIVAFYSGNLSPLTAFKTIDKYFSQIPQHKSEPEQRLIIPPIQKPFDRSNKIPSHQAHCIIGARTPGYLDPDRIPTALLANILAGPGMNSLLNIQLREQRGLVYSVEASTTLYSDSAATTIYFGCDHDDLATCRRIINRTIQNLPQTLTSKKLEAAKRQYLGQLVLASENRENQLLSAARSALWRKKIISDAHAKQQILAITIDDINRVITPLLKPSTLIFTN